jgi:two-component system sensor histidine kinase RegB
MNVKAQRSTKADHRMFHGGSGAMTSPAIAEDSQSAHTRLSTLVLIRWMAIAGQTLVVVIDQMTVGGLDMVLVSATIGASAAVNLWLSVAPGPRRRLDEAHAAAQLAFDIVQLAALLGLTGGLANPFALFLLAPVTVGAATLSVRATMSLAVMAVVALSVIARWHAPLPWLGAPMELPVLYRFAVWSALAMGVVSVSLFTWSIASESRRLAAAYSQSRLALERERRVAEVGALAAAVAHELNTPLGTVCLIAHELEHELKGGALEADVAMLIGQADRCRDSLARLTRSGERAQAVEQEAIPFPALVELAAQAHGGALPVIFDHHPMADAPGAVAPWIARDPAVLHGLGNFIQNAGQFAHGQVEVETSWSPTQRMVRIADDGPGFAPHLLERLGEPYLSGRDDDRGHMGLGIFIAVTLLARTGAAIQFANAPEGGAEITVTWSGLP